jgi:hypothetical protein
MTNFTTRFWSQVDKTDTCWNWTGCLINGGYGKTTNGGKQSLVHRVSYEMSGELIPEGMFIDHICSNRKCVRPDHLRLATRKENSEHLTGAYKNSQSGVRGVNRRGDRWRAQVRHNGKLISCGQFATIEEAEAAVIAKRLELFTHNDSDRAA